MPDDRGLDDTLRRAMDANIRYYRALGEVTVDYVRALSGLWGDVRLPVDLGTFRLPNLSARAEPEPPAPAAAEPQPVLVLEAAAGDEARGVFLIENHLGRTVSTTVRIGTFRAEGGAAAAPPTRVEPEAIVLEPGESTLVHLVAHVDDALDPEVEYRAQVDVPDLAAAGIPVVLRRIAPPVAQPAPAAKAARGARKAAPASAERGVTARRSTGRKSAGSSRQGKAEARTQARTSRARGRSAEGDG